MNIELKITLWALACAYALGNSFIYSWTFWTAFDIDILQFASLTDLIPSIIYNLTIPFVIVVLAVIVAEVWIRLKTRIEKIIDAYLSSYIKNYEKVKLMSSLIASFIFAIIGVIGAIYSFKTIPPRPSSEDFPWLDVLKIGVPIPLTFFIIYIIIENTSFFSNIKYRRLVIFCLCIVPVTSYFWGVINSQKIKQGKNTFIVKSDTQCKSTPGTQFRYISSVSDKAFALSLRDGSVCIFKYNNLELIPEINYHYTVSLESKAI